MKKALSMFLVLMLLLGMMPMQAFATEGTQETEAVEVVTEPTEAPEEEPETPREHAYENGICTGCGVVSEESVANGTCGDALTWILDKNGVLTISGTGEMYDYGFRAEEEIVVNAPWTAYKNEIITVVLEEGVANIGQAAFGGCANLKSVVFSEDITDIGNQAFSNCVSLETVTLPESLSSIGKFAFNGCSSMESIRIPAGVTTIGSHAFSNCSGLTMVEIPGGIAQISERMFNGCSSLTAVKIPAGVTGIGDYAFFGCKSLETAELPDGLASIGEYAFGDCVALTGIVLPESLVSIGNSAFSACSSLTEIILPAAVENLGNSVFYNCYSLRNVTLPANLESIGEWVFYGCGLTSIDIPDRVTGIGPYAFYSCDYLTSVEIPDSVTSVGEHAFCDCIRLTSIKLPKGLASIGNSAFGHCKSLKEITFTGDAPAIAESAFANVTATVLYPSNNVTWSADACQNYGANALTWTAYCDHTYENIIVTAPTCTEQGYTTYTCACGDSYVADYVDATGHTYKNGICTVCGATQPGPVITQQPESVQQEVGKKFAITVMAEGEGLTYQWYVKNSGTEAFKVSSNKTASYAYTMQTYMHNRQVYCVVTDANGNSVQTEVATISRPPQTLKILQQPQDARVNVGEKFSISPKVEGEGLIYQWYVKENGAKAFKVSSVRGSAYALTMQKYMIGRQVYCVITDKHGNSVTTDVATISLPPVELKILEQPSDVYASKGEKFSISPKVQGEGLTYQWYYKEGYMKDFKPSSNKTSAYAYSMQLYMNERSVYCVITDKFGNQVQTEAVTIYLGNLIMK